MSGPKLRAVRIARPGDSSILRAGRFVRTGLARTRRPAANIFPKYRPGRLAHQQIINPAVERLAVDRTAGAKRIQEMRDIFVGVFVARQENALIKYAAADHLL